MFIQSFVRVFFRIGFLSPLLVMARTFSPSDSVSVFIVIQIRFNLYFSSIFYDNPNLISKKVFFFFFLLYFLRKNDKFSSSVFFLDHQVLKSCPIFPKFMHLVWALCTKKVIVTRFFSKTTNIFRILIWVFFFWCFLTIKYSSDNCLKRFSTLKSTLFAHESG